MSLKLNFFQQSSMLLIPDLIKIITTVISSIFLAKIFGPERLGIYAAAALAMTYGTLLHLGIKNGAGLQVPFFIGKGEFNFADQCVNSSITGILAILFLFTAPFGFLIYYFVDNYELMVGLYLTWISLFLYEIYNMAEAKARLNYRIKNVFYSQIFLHITRIFLLLYLAATFGLIGAFIGLIVCYVPSLVYLYLNGERIYFSWDYEEIFKLIKIGFPLMLAGLLMTLFISIDRWIIISFIGIDQLGYYTFVIGITGVITIIPQKIASFLSQYIREAVGADVDIKIIIKATGIVYFLCLVLLAPCILMIYHSGIYLISGFLVEYKESIPLFDVLIYASFFLTTYYFYSQLLVGLNLRKELLISQGLSLIFLIFANFLALKLGYGLMGIAFASLCGSLFLSFSVVYAAYKKIGTLKNSMIGYSILSILITVIVFNIIDISSLTNITNLYEGMNTFFKIIAIDFVFLIFILIIIIKLNITKSVMGFLRRDFSRQQI